ncbi:MAG TPA: hypothetical protein VK465_11825 [Fibrobacteria bacterium]|nr:hypothetical protein [Fibrobacteria bacterium]
MAEVRSGKVQSRRISRSGKSDTKRSSRKGAKSVRVEGLKQVDTIPRLEQQDNDDGESKGLARLLESEIAEGFSQGTFADDLQRTLAFVERLPLDAVSGRPSELHLECARILQAEVTRAKETAALRKAVPRA